MAVVVIIVGFGTGGVGTGGVSLVELFKRSKDSTWTGGRAGRALEKRDRPVLGVWRDDDDGDCGWNMMGRDW